MGDAILRGESAVQYSKDLVDGALAHQRISAGELTASYVVQLLASLLQHGPDDDEPLALKRARL